MKTIPDGTLPRIVLLLLFVGLMWFVRALDALNPHSVSVMGLGIIPRTWIGLSGIPIAPFVHESWRHLIENSVPLLVLGALILMRGVPEFVFVTGIVVAISGLGTWIFGGAGQHIGASGVVLGFASFLLFRSAFDRRPSSFVITAFVIAVGATSIAFALMPHGRVSWSLHAFGFIGGFVAARLRYPPRPKVDPRVKAAMTVLEFPARKG